MWSVAQCDYGVYVRIVTVIKQRHLRSLFDSRLMKRLNGDLRAAQHHWGTRCHFCRCMMSVLNPCGSMLLLHEIQLSLMHEQTAALWKYTGSIRLSPVSFHLHAGAISAAVWSIKVPVQIVYRLKHLPCLQLNRSDNVCFALSHSHV